MWLTARLFGLRLSCTVRGIAQPSRFPNYFSMIWVARRGVSPLQKDPQVRTKDFPTITISWLPWHGVYKF
ncbi:hypothetical protein T06_8929 [Trichinella sp. T6]|nr:hypothetical protein T06_8929 [Trichinella sp. T6]